MNLKAGLILLLNSTAFIPECLYVKILPASFFYPMELSAPYLLLDTVKEAMEKNTGESPQ